MEPCCQDGQNLVTHQGPAPGTMIQVCQICHRRHYTMTADPGTLTVKLGAILKAGAPNA